MRTHQLVLSRDPHAQNILRDRFGLTQVEVKQLIYGRLFYPMGVDDVPLARGMATDGLRGRWLYRSEWERWMSNASRLRIVPKPLWPVVLTSELAQTLPVVEAVELLDHAAERCTLFAADDSLEPIFLVPDTWPNSED